MAAAAQVTGERATRSWPPMVIHDISTHLAIESKRYAATLRARLRRPLALHIGARSEVALLQHIPVSTMPTQTSHLSDGGRTGLDFSFAQQTGEVLDRLCQSQNLGLAKLINLLM